MEESDSPGTKMYTKYLQMPFLLPGIRINLIIDRSLSLGTYNTYVLDIVTFTYEHVCMYVHTDGVITQ